MVINARLKRGSFMSRSLEVCDAFAFAAPIQVPRAVKVYYRASPRKARRTWPGWGYCWSCWSSAAPELHVEEEKDDDLNQIIDYLCTM